MLGELGWISNQTRPDLAASTSLSQQSMPKPKGADLRRINNTARRCWQHSGFCLQFLPIDIKQLSFAGLSDASLSNIKKIATQSGILVVAVEKKLGKNEESLCSLVTWKTGRLTRVVPSSLAAESVALSTC